MNKFDNVYLSTLSSLNENITNQNLDIVARILAAQQNPSSSEAQKLRSVLTNVLSKVSPTAVGTVATDSQTFTDDEKELIKNVLGSQSNTVTPTTPKPTTPTPTPTTVTPSTPSSVTVDPNTQTSTTPNSTLTTSTSSAPSQPGTAEKNQNTV